MQKGIMPSEDKELFVMAVKSAVAKEFPNGKAKSVSEYEVGKERVYDRIKAEYPAEFNYFIYRNDHALLGQVGRVLQCVRPSRKNGNAQPPLLTGNGSNGVAPAAPKNGEKKRINDTYQEMVDTFDIIPSDEVVTFLLGCSSGYIGIIRKTLESKGYVFEKSAFGHVVKSRPAEEPEETPEEKRIRELKEAAEKLQAELAELMGQIGK